MADRHDVLIVGAGAAGVGMGVVLLDLGVGNFTIVERYEVGASFLRWPAEMRFISPSFTSNGFGLLDLNAVTINTSPAHTLREEHPTGHNYAQYLKAVASHFELPVREGVEVYTMQPEAEGFRLYTSAGQLQSRFVIWAAGEFQYPNTEPVDGAEHCIHNATVASWKELAGDDFTVIGGFESGIDAAVTLVRLGKQVRVLDAAAPWAFSSPDPSLVLSPYTQSRLRKAQATGRLELVPGGVKCVERQNGHFVIHGSEGERWTSPTPPILATGFAGSLGLVHDLFDWHEEHNYALLTENDESTKTPGLFVVGPAVRHGSIILCFIYKFRQRFAVVARAIGERLGLDTSVLEAYRPQMFLDDLSCCDDTCAC
ncbi:MAG: monooxygenase [Chloroflexi bacterium]|nr:MAG: monooxygenase [Chloroflexota bacterium]